MRELTFSEILPFWNKLWPERQSPIEPQSNMMLDGTYANNVDQPTWFYGLEDRDGAIVGVNSVHLCADGMFRSRGLWVEPQCRALGFGRQLLAHGIQLARGARGVWSFPRQSSWFTYQAAGFILTTGWSQSETSEANAYCALYFNA